MSFAFSDFFNKSVDGGLEVLLLILSLLILNFSISRILSFDRFLLSQ
ncbi:MAG: hypothetical protein F6K39_40445 [Okeania sp. SIO3B3]|nr:hypothetical protein [Okeania sp. SIO3B3]